MSTPEKRKKMTKKKGRKTKGGKKKELIRTAKVSQLVPKNLETEKIMFYKKNGKYDPQFKYVFDKMKLPVKVISIKSPMKN